MGQMNTLAKINEIFTIMHTIIIVDEIKAPRNLGANRRV